MPRQAPHPAPDPVLSSAEGPREREEGTAFPVSTRVSGFSYAIRNIVTEAKKVEAAGKRVHYLNIGDPVAFGFQPPSHLLLAVERAIRDGHNGYGPSVGTPAGREAVAQDYQRRGWQVSPDRVVLTSGASEGIDLTLNALVNPNEEVLVPSPTYPLYTAVLAKIGGRAVFYPTPSERGWQPDLDALERLITPATRALVIIHPNNPTGAVYSTETLRALLELANRRGLVILSDEVYADLAFAGPVPPLASLDPASPIIAFGSLSKGFLAPGWRAGWLAVSNNARLDGVLAAIKKLADGRLCSALPMQHAIVAALSGDRSHQEKLRTALRARAAVTAQSLHAIPRMSYVPASAAFYAMPRVALPKGMSDEQFVLELLRATGVLCVHGSGFGMRPADGYFRIVFLADPDELARVYDAMKEFTEQFFS